MTAKGTISSTIVAHEELAATKQEAMPLVEFDREVNLYQDNDESRASTVNESEAVGIQKATESGGHNLTERTEIRPPCPASLASAALADFRPAGSGLARVASAAAHTEEDRNPLLTEQGPDDYSQQIR